jgi:hypothetical protein
MGAPIFAWRDAVARGERTGSALNGLATVTAWQALGGAGKRSAASSRQGAGRRGPLGQLRRRARTTAIRTAFPLLVAALNRAGLGPMRADISGVELRRAGLAAIGEVAARMDLGEAWVVFGHTHRAGPLPADEQGEWRGRGGARLINCGSWTYAAIFLDETGAQNPYWPGRCVLVGPDGPPVLQSLLSGLSREQLRPPSRRAAKAV